MKFFPKLLFGFKFRAAIPEGVALCNHFNRIHVLLLVPEIICRHSFHWSIVTFSRLSGIAPPPDLSSK